MDKVLQDSPVVRAIATGYPYLKDTSGTEPGLEGNEVHIWTAHFKDLDRDYKALSALISRDEQKKASQYKKPGDARRWILRRGYLRLVLSYYLCSDPALLPLITGDHGKPGMDTRGGYSPISFSLSHTGEMVALGITRKNDIGIDIVKPDEQYPFRDTAVYLFSPAERAVLSRARPDLQYRQFFRIWALKEALLKATGGTVMMMKDIDVSGIVPGMSVDNRYPIRYRYAEREFFIHECNCNYGHHYAIAAGLNG